MNKLHIIFILFCINACSNKAIYENIRMHQRKECLKEPQSVYEECLESTDKSYEEYDRERREI